MNPCNQIMRELMKSVCNAELFPMSHLSISNSLCFLCSYALICVEWLLENNQALLHGKIRSYGSLSFLMFIIVHLSFLNLHLTESIGPCNARSPHPLSFLQFLPRTFSQFLAPCRWLQWCMGRLKTSWSSRRQKLGLTD